MVTGRRETRWNFSTQSPPAHTPSAPVRIRWSTAIAPVGPSLVLDQLGHLEAAEDPPAQLEGIIDALHTRRETREVVVAEVRLAGPRSDDERVVCRDAGLVQHGGGDGVGGEVDIGDLAEQNA